MTNLIKVGAIVLAGVIAVPSFAYAQMEQPMSGNDSMERSGAMPMNGGRSSSSSMKMKKKQQMMMKKKKKMMMRKDGM